MTLAYAYSPGESWGIWILVVFIVWMCALGIRNYQRERDNPVNRDHVKLTKALRKITEEK